MKLKDAYKILKSIFKNHDMRCIKIEIKPNRESIYLCDDINLISRNIFSGKISFYNKNSRVVFKAKDIIKISGLR